MIARALIVVGLAVPVSMFMGAFIPEWLAVAGGIAYGGAGAWKLFTWIETRGAPDG